MTDTETAAFATAENTAITGNPAFTTVAPPIADMTAAVATLNTTLEAQNTTLEAQRQAAAGKPACA